MAIFGPSKNKVIESIDAETGRIDYFTEITKCAKVDQDRPKSRVSPQGILRRSLLFFSNVF
jgi:hypothetical protein